MMNVYRIEDNNGCGPYRDGRCVTWPDNHFQADYHPLPSSDGIFNMNSDYICGFASLIKLMDWFTSCDRCALDKAGYSIVCYLSEDIQFGRRQLIFRKMTAVKKMELPLRNAQ